MAAGAATGRKAARALVREDEEQELQRQREDADDERKGEAVQQQRETQTQDVRHQQATRSARGLPASCGHPRVGTSFEPLCPTTPQEQQQQQELQQPQLQRQLLEEQQPQQKGPEQQQQQMQEEKKQQQEQKDQANGEQPEQQQPKSGLQQAVQPRSSADEQRAGSWQQECNRAGERVDRCMTCTGDEGAASCSFPPPVTASASVSCYPATERVSPQPHTPRQTQQPAASNGDASQQQQQRQQQHQGEPSVLPHAAQPQQSEGSTEETLAFLEEPLLPPTSDGAAQGTGSSRSGSSRSGSSRSGSSRSGSSRSGSSSSNEVLRRKLQERRIIPPPAKNAYEGVSATGVKDQQRARGASLRCDSGAAAAVPLTQQPQLSPVAMAGHVADPAVADGGVGPAGAARADGDCGTHAQRATNSTAAPASARIARVPSPDDEVFACDGPAAGAACTDASSAAANSAKIDDTAPAVAGVAAVGSSGETCSKTDTAGQCSSGTQSQEDAGARTCGYSIGFVTPREQQPHKEPDARHQLRPPRQPQRQQQVAVAGCAAVGDFCGEGAAAAPCSPAASRPGRRSPTVRRGSSPAPLLSSSSTAAGMAAAESEAAYPAATAAPGAALPVTNAGAAASAQGTSSTFQRSTARDGCGGTDRAAAVHQGDPEERRRDTPCSAPLQLPVDQVPLRSAADGSAPSVGRDLRQQQLQQSHAQQHPPSRPHPPQRWQPQQPQLHAQEQGSENGSASCSDEEGSPGGGPWPSSGLVAVRTSSSSSCPLPAAHPRAASSFSLSVSLPAAVASQPFAAASPCLAATCRAAASAVESAAAAAGAVPSSSLPARRLSSSAAAASHKLFSGHASFHRVPSSPAAVNAASSKATASSSHALQPIMEVAASAGSASSTVRVAATGVSRALAASRAGAPARTLPLGARATVSPVYPPRDAADIAPLHRAAAGPTADGAGAASQPSITTRNALPASAGIPRLPAAPPCSRAGGSSSSSTFQGSSKTASSGNPAGNSDHTFSRSSSNTNSLSDSAVDTDIAMRRHVGTQAFTSLPSAALESLPPSRSLPILCKYSSSARRAGNAACLDTPPTAGTAVSAAVRNTDWVRPPDFVARGCPAAAAAAAVSSSSGLLGASSRAAAVQRRAAFAPAGAAELFGVAASAAALAASHSSLAAAAATAERCPDGACAVAPGSSPAGAADSADSHFDGRSRSSITAGNNPATARSCDSSYSSSRAWRRTSSAPPSPSNFDVLSEEDAAAVNSTNSYRRVQVAELQQILLALQRLRQEHRHRLALLRTRGGENEEGVTNDSSNRSRISTQAAAHESSSRSRGQPQAAANRNGSSSGTSPAARSRSSGSRESPTASRSSSGCHSPIPSSSSSTNRKDVLGGSVASVRGSVVAVAVQDLPREKRRTLARDEQSGTEQSPVDTAGQQANREAAGAAAACETAAESSARGRTGELTPERGRGEGEKVKKSREGRQMRDEQTEGKREAEERVPFFEKRGASLFAGPTASAAAGSTGRAPVPAGTAASIAASAAAAGPACGRKQESAYPYHKAEEPAAGQLLSYKDGGQGAVTAGGKEAAATPAAAAAGTTKPLHGSPQQHQRGSGFGAWLLHQAGRASPTYRGSLATPGDVGTGAAAAAGRWLRSERSHTDSTAGPGRRRLSSVLGGGEEKGTLTSGDAGRKTDRRGLGGAARAAAAVGGRGLAAAASVLVEEKTRVDGLPRLKSRTPATPVCSSATSAQESRTVNSNSSSKTGRAGERAAAVQEELHAKEQEIQFLRERLRQLVSQMDEGVPMALRGGVWKELLLADALADQGDAGEETHAPSCESLLAQRIMEIALDEPNQRVIHSDVERTRASLTFYRDPETRAWMERLLTSYCKTQGVKYKQGLNELLDAFQCFQAFAQKYLAAMFCDDEFTSLQCAFHLFKQLLTYHDPALSGFLESRLVTPELYVTPWFLTLFSSKTSLPVLFALWDRYLADGDPHFFPFIALALLIFCRRDILSTEVSQLPETLSKVTIHSVVQLRQIWDLADDLRLQTPWSFYQRMVASQDVAGGEAALVADLQQLEAEKAFFTCPQEVLNHAYGMNAGNAMQLGLGATPPRCRPVRSFPHSFVTSSSAGAAAGGASPAAGLWRGVTAAAGEPGFAACAGVTRGSPEETRERRSHEDRSASASSSFPRLSGASAENVAAQHLRDSGAASAHEHQQQECQQQAHVLRHEREQQRRGGRSEAGTVAAKERASSGDTRKEAHRSTSALRLSPHSAGASVAAALSSSSYSSLSARATRAAPVSAEATAASPNTGVAAEADQGRSMHAAPTAAPTEAGGPCDAGVAPAGSSSAGGLPAVPGPPPWKMLLLDLRPEWSFEAAGKLPPAIQLDLLGDWRHAVSSLVGAVDPGDTQALSPPAAVSRRDETASLGLSGYERGSSSSAPGFAAGARGVAAVAHVGAGGGGAWWHTEEEVDGLWERDRTLKQQRELSLLLSQSSALPRRHQTLEPKQAGGRRAVAAAGSATNLASACVGGSGYCFRRRRSSSVSSRRSAPPRLRTEADPDGGADVSACASQQEHQTLPRRLLHELALRVDRGRSSNGSCGSGWDSSRVSYNSTFSTRIERENPSSRFQSLFWLPSPQHRPQLQDPAPRASAESEEAAATGARGAAAHAVHAANAAAAVATAAGARGRNCSTGTTGREVTPAFSGSSSSRRASSAGDDRLATNEEKMVHLSLSSFIDANTSRNSRCSSGATASPPLRKREESKDPLAERAVRGADNAAAFAALTPSSCSPDRSHYSSREKPRLLRTTEPQLQRRHPRAAMQKLRQQDLLAQEEWDCLLPGDEEDEDEKTTTATLPVLDGQQQQQDGGQQQQLRHQPPSAAAAATSSRGGKDISAGGGGGTYGRIRASRLLRSFRRRTQQMLVGAPAAGTASGTPQTVSPACAGSNSSTLSRTPPVTADCGSCPPADEWKAEQAAQSSCVALSGAAALLPSQRRADEAQQPPQLGGPSRTAAARLGVERGDTRSGAVVFAQGHYSSSSAPPIQHSFTPGVPAGGSSGRENFREAAANRKGRWREDEEATQLDMHAQRNELRAMRRRHCALWLAHRGHRRAAGGVAGVAGTAAERAVSQLTPEAAEGKEEFVGEDRHRQQEDGAASVAQGGTRLSDRSNGHVCTSQTRPQMQQMGGHKGGFQGVQRSSKYAGEEESFSDDPGMYIHSAAISPPPLVTFYSAPSRLFGAAASAVDRAVDRRWADARGERADATAPSAPDMSSGAAAVAAGRACPAAAAARYYGACVFDAASHTDAAAAAAERGNASVVAGLQRRPSVVAAASDAATSGGIAAHRRRQRLLRSSKWSFRPRRRVSSAANELDVAGPQGTLWHRLKSRSKALPAHGDAGAAERRECPAAGPQETGGRDALAATTEGPPREGGPGNAPATGEEAATATDAVPVDEAPTAGADAGRSSGGGILQPQRVAERSQSSSSRSGGAPSESVDVRGLATAGAAVGVSSLPAGFCAPATAAHADFNRETGEDGGSSSTTQQKKKREKEPSSGEHVHSYIRGGNSVRNSRGRGLLNAKREHCRGDVEDIKCSDRRYSPGLPLGPAKWAASAASGCLRQLHSCSSLYSRCCAGGERETLALLPLLQQVSFSDGDVSPPRAAVARSAAAASEQTCQSLGEAGPARNSLDAAAGAAVGADFAGAGAAKGLLRMRRLPTVSKGSLPRWGGLLQWQQERLQMKETAGVVGFVRRQKEERTTQQRREPVETGRGEGGGATVKQQGDPESSISSSDVCGAHQWPPLPAWSREVAAVASRSRGSELGNPAEGAEMLLPQQRDGRESGDWRLAAGTRAAGKNGEGGGAAEERECSRDNASGSSDRGRRRSGTADTFLPELRRHSAAGEGGRQRDGDAEATGGGRAVTVFQVRAEGRDEKRKHGGAEARETTRGEGTVSLLLSCPSPADVAAGEGVAPASAGRRGTGGTGGVVTPADEERGGEKAEKNSAAAGAGGLASGDAERAAGRADAAGRGERREAGQAEEEAGGRVGVLRTAAGHRRLAGTADESRREGDRRLPPAAAAWESQFSVEGDSDRRMRGSAAGGGGSSTASARQWSSVEELCEYERRLQVAAAAGSAARLLALQRRARPSIFLRQRECRPPQQVQQSGAGGRRAEELQNSESVSPCTHRTLMSVEDNRRAFEEERVQFPTHHICLIPPDDDCTAAMEVYRVLTQEMALRWVSIAKGGYLACHDLALQEGLELVDHEPASCPLCSHHRRRGKSSSGKMHAAAAGLRYSILQQPRGSVVAHSPYRPRPLPALLQSPRRRRQGRGGKETAKSTAAAAGRTASFSPPQAEQRFLRSVAAASSASSSSGAEQVDTRRGFTNSSAAAAAAASPKETASLPAEVAGSSQGAQEEFVAPFCSSSRREGGDEPGSSDHKKAKVSGGVQRQEALCKSAQRKQVEGGSAAALAAAPGRKASPAEPQKDANAACSPLLSGQNAAGAASSRLAVNDNREEADKLLATGSHDSAAGGRNSSHQEAGEGEGGHHHHHGGHSHSSNMPFGTIIGAWRRLSASTSTRHHVSASSSSAGKSVNRPGSSAPATAITSVSPLLSSRADATAEGATGAAVCAFHRGCGQAEVLCGARVTPAAAAAVALFNSRDKGAAGAATPSHCCWHCPSITRWQQSPSAQPRWPCAACCAADRDGGTPLLLLPAAAHSPAVFARGPESAASPRHADVAATCPSTPCSYCASVAVPSATLATLQQPRPLAPRSPCCCCCSAHNSSAAESLSTSTAAGISPDKVESVKHPTFHGVLRRHPCSHHRLSDTFPHACAAHAPCCCLRPDADSGDGRVTAGLGPCGSPRCTHMYGGCLLGSLSTPAAATVREVSASRTVAAVSAAPPFGAPRPMHLSSGHCVTSAARGAEGPRARVTHTGSLPSTTAAGHCALCVHHHRSVLPRSSSTGCVREGADVRLQWREANTCSSATVQGRSAGGGGVNKERGPVAGHLLDMPSSAVVSEESRRGTQEAETLRSSASVPDAAEGEKLDAESSSRGCAAAGSTRPGEERQAAQTTTAQTSAFGRAPAEQKAAQQNQHSRGTEQQHGESQGAQQQRQASRRAEVQHQDSRIAQLQRSQSSGSIYFGAYAQTPAVPLALYYLSWTAVLRNCQVTAAGEAATEAGFKPAENPAEAKSGTGRSTDEQEMHQEFCFIVGLLQPPLPLAHSVSVELRRRRQRRRRRYSGLQRQQHLEVEDSSRANPGSEQQLALSSFRSVIDKASTAAFGDGKSRRRRSGAAAGGDSAAGGVADRGAASAGAVDAEDARGAAPLVGRTERGKEAGDGQREDCQGTGGGKGTRPRRASTYTFPLCSVARVEPARTSEEQTAAAGSQKAQKKRISTASLLAASYSSVGAALATYGRRKKRSSAGAESGGTQLAVAPETSRRNSTSSQGDRCRSTTRSFLMLPLTGSSSSGMASASSVSGRPPGTGAAAAPAAASSPAAAGSSAAGAAAEGRRGSTAGEKDSGGRSGAAQQKQGSEGGDGAGAGPAEAAVTSKVRHGDSGAHSSRRSSYQWPSLFGDREKSKASYTAAAAAGVGDVSGGAAAAGSCAAAGTIAALSSGGAAGHSVAAGLAPGYEHLGGWEMNVPTQVRCLLLLTRRRLLVVSEPQTVLVQNRSRGHRRQQRSGSANDSSVTCELAGGGSKRSAVDDSEKDGFTGSGSDSRTSSGDGALRGDIEKLKQEEMEPEEEQEEEQEAEQVEVEEEEEEEEEMEEDVIVNESQLQGGSQGVEAEKVFMVGGRSLIDGEDAVRFCGLEPSEQKCAAVMSAEEVEAAGASARALAAIPARAAAEGAEETAAAAAPGDKVVPAREAAAATAAEDAGAAPAGKARLRAAEEVRASSTASETEGAAEGAPEARETAEGNAQPSDEAGARRREAPAGEVEAAGQKKREDKEGREGSEEVPGAAPRAETTVGDRAGEKTRSRAGAVREEQVVRVYASFELAEILKITSKKNNAKLLCFYFAANKVYADTQIDSYDCSYASACVLTSRLSSIAYPCSEAAAQPLMVLRFESAAAAHQCIEFVRGKYRRLKLQMQTLAQQSRDVGPQPQSGSSSSKP